MTNKIAQQTNKNVLPALKDIISAYNLLSPSIKKDPEGIKYMQKLRSVYTDNQQLLEVLKKLLTIFSFYKINALNLNEKISKLIEVLSK